MKRDSAVVALDERRPRHRRRCRRPASPPGGPAQRRCPTRVRRPRSARLRARPAAARRTAAAGESPARRPWPGRAARGAAASRAAADPAPLVAAMRSKEASTSRISSDGASAAGTSRIADSCAQPIPSRPWRGSPVRNATTIASSSGGVRFQQIGEMADLLEAAGGPGDGAGGGDDFGEAHVLMLKQSGSRPAVSTTAASRRARPS